MKSMSMTRRMLGGKMAERYHVSVERLVGLQNFIIPVVIAQTKMGREVEICGVGTH